MQETETRIPLGTVTEPHEDVEDLMFRAESGWYTSER